MKTGKGIFIGALIMAVLFFMYVFVDSILDVKKSRKSIHKEPVVYTAKPIIKEFDHGDYRYTVARFNTNTTILLDKRKLSNLERTLKGKDGTNK
jgi:hypothetical protein